MKTGKRSVCPRVFLAGMVVVGAAHGAGLKYWVEACARPAEMGCKSGDAELAQWAMEALADGIGRQAAGRADYGEESGDHPDILGDGTRRVIWRDARAAMSLFAPSLARDSCGRLRCILLACTRPGTRWGWVTRRTSTISCTTFNMAEISLEYFGRYVRKLVRREDIRKYSGMSPNDKKRLAAGL